MKNKIFLNINECLKRFMVKIIELIFNDGKVINYGLNKTKRIQFTFLL